ncbi:hypothetical protein HNP52_003831, partial [Sphingomonas kyeonggiensis]
MAPNAAWAASAACNAINAGTVYATNTGNPATLSGTYRVDAVGNTDSNYSDPGQTFAIGEVVSYTWSTTSGTAYAQILHMAAGDAVQADSARNLTGSGSGSFTINAGSTNWYFNIAATDFTIASDGSGGASEPARRNSQIAITISCAAPSPILGASLTHGGTPKQGSNFTLLPTVSNTGTATTSGNITLTSTLPTGLTLVGGSGTNWSCTGNGTVNVSCTFSGTIATGASNTALSLTVAASATSATPRNVTIGVSGGGASNTPTASDNIAIALQPAITSISPTNGPTGGGNTVAITGNSFTGTTGAGGVKFGAANATGYTVISDTQINATAPAGAAGTVDITVTNGGNTSATSSADQYTYVSAPTVTAVSPTAGPTAGGTTVVITGTGFSAAPGTGAVKFGASNATYTINSNTQITATSPANSAGT